MNTGKNIILRLLARFPSINIAHRLLGIKKAVLDVVISMIFGLMLLGIWLVASLRGGITSLDNSENMANFFQNLWITINPFERLTRGFEYFYFGFAAFVVIVFGILFGYES